MIQQCLPTTNDCWVQLTCIDCKSEKLEVFRAEGGIGVTTHSSQWKSGSQSQEKEFEL